MAAEQTKDGKADAVLREIATVMTDPLYPAWDGLLRADDDTLATRGGAKGLRIYDELLRDTRAHSIVQKRQTAVTARDWYIDPAAESGPEREAAALVESVLKRMNFDKLCLDLLDALVKGFAVAELMPVVRHGRVEIDYAIARDQRRFAFTDERELRLLTREAMVHGVPIPERKFIRHTFGGKDGNPNGLGLGSKLFWPVFFKRQGIKFWLTLADRYGTPTTMGSYPAGTQDDEVDKVLRGLRALAREGVIVKPEGWVIELLESRSAGNITTHEALCRYMDEQMAECVLGETLTTNVGTVGSKAAAETHNDVREILVRHDADMLSETLNRTLVRWIIEWNMGFDVEPPLLWRSFSEEEDLNARAPRDEALQRMGWYLTPERFAEIYGEGYEFRGGQSEARAAPPGAPGAPGLGDPALAFSEAGEPERDLADDLADQLDQVAGPVTDRAIDRIRALLDEAADFEEFSQKLLALYPALPAEDLAALLRDAMTVAELSGRAEILDGR
jgi:phage gp29-like protein